MYQRTCVYILYIYIINIAININTHCMCIYIYMRVHLMNFLGSLTGEFSSGLIEPCLLEKSLDGFGYIGIYTNMGLSAIGLPPIEIAILIGHLVIDHQIWDTLS